MQRNGWSLLFHECLFEQLRSLEAAVQRARQQNPQGYAANANANANAKLFNTLSRLMLEVVPHDPSRDEYRQGNTLSGAFRHWRRAKIDRRFRLFFRYDSRARIIVFAWINDETTLCSSGSRSDHYAGFQRMLERGHPPDDWEALRRVSREGWDEK